jgi:adenosine deaminase
MPLDLDARAPMVGTRNLFVVGRLAGGVTGAFRRAPARAARSCGAFRRAAKESRMRRRRFLGVLAAGTMGTSLRADGQVRDIDAALTRARAWLGRLPKAEFHVHLEGAMPRPVLWQLITKYGGDKTVPTVDDLERKFAQTPFFVGWDWVCGFLREADDFSLLGREVARDFARQNIRYAEAFFSPTVFRRQMTPQPIAEALRKGLDEVRTVRVGLVADLGRNLGHDGAMRTLEQVAEVRRAGVIGVGLGGFEPQYAHEVFAPVYERARALGFRTTAHAGETAGAASVWGAIRALRVDRLGHAVRAAEDPALVAHLAKTRIPLELCLTGNVRGRQVDSYASHPVRRYFDLGIPISLNTDDPLFFGNSLVDEYAAAMQFHRFTRDDVKRVIASAIETSWLGADARAELLRDVRRDAAWNEAG